ncbi:tRNA (N6-threonylcarbamoyladenosine(37)-N6)-methyltransferase TrmO [Thermohalobacter berrensis]|uniref:tRNA-Thr(GGU) m(6)t(6)A37 methyltransferase TsaA n=1 Tax=Thermohalobacter berrensis TaxID=99594 RepID=A0A419SXR5_9FIRM|nr:tRNA (N6-threonylcarbamoyladenosine(37)-N6)-methyltransferase TrmO [Thermohalobacter berrensis]RKD30024.1 tRNA-Thr(GGU) m(6)t(6)A37 methyltransferase TsaA [Thermohalobacter berrensis]
MNELVYKPIGIIRSPFTEPKGTPIQPSGAIDIEGKIEVFPEYKEGLKDIEGFSHIILLYHFHLVKKSTLLAKPFMDDKKHGIFAIRGPSRPNPIGLSIVRLEKVEENTLYIKDVDIIDGTPLLDIKPYVPKFDIKEVKKIGWLEKNVHKVTSMKDDGRFVNE